MPVKYILFDAANTLIHKPALWDKILTVLHQHNIDMPLSTLQYHHKLLSEVTDFPDKTSKDFYLRFNSELLLSLGVVPGQALLDDIFSACNYLPWEKFDDTAVLSALGLPLGVLSNFNNGLPQLLGSLFGNIFSDVIVSEDLRIRKPDIAFFRAALNATGLAPANILYIGDSLKLDMLPALQVGFKVALIDRLNIFKASDLAIRRLDEIRGLI